jgi:hypothetical protein
MGGLEKDPWSIAGLKLSEKAARTLAKLRHEGDELETREAWLERLSEQAQCPECGGELGLVGAGDVPQIICLSDNGHLRWP